VLPDDASPLLHARALRVLGGCVAVVGDLELTRALGEETLAMYQELGDEAGIEHMLHRVANGALALGELARARALSEQSMEIAERRGSRLGMAWSLGTLASIDWAEGQSERSFELARRSAVLASENGYEWWEIVQHYAMSERSRELRRFDDVERYARTGLAVAHRIGERQYRIYLLALLARAAVEHGRLERAGTIWGSVEAEERHGPFGQWEREGSDYSAPVLAHDGPEFARGRERGRSLTIDEAVAYALDA
jgi:ATP/maltotriose-dependent transcriptional regulator MalT